MSVAELAYVLHSFCLDYSPFQPVAPRQPAYCYSFLSRVVFRAFFARSRPSSSSPEVLQNASLFILLFFDDVGLVGIDRVLRWMSRVRLSSYNLAFSYVAHFLGLVAFDFFDIL